MCSLPVAAHAPPLPLAIPAGDPGVVSILYPFLDCTRELPAIAHDPAAGPMGSMICLPWEAVNPTPGGYDWSAIDAQLEAARQVSVTLSSGVVISQPLVLQVLPHLHSLPGWEGVLFYDATPTWVYDEIDGQRPEAPRPLANGRKVGYLFEGCDTHAVMPMYDSDTWQQRYFECVQALGTRYDDEPLITTVIANTGLDGETQPIKDYGCTWNDIMDQTLGLGMRYLAFPQYIKDAMDAYRAAFPHTALFVDAAPGGGSIRRIAAEHAASLSPPIGLKNSAMWTDINIHQGYGTYVGIWDMVAQYSMTLPIWLESAYGLGDAAHNYWSLLAGLHYHPDAMDLHPEYWPVTAPEILGWVNAHLGCTVQNTPSVWTAFRDYEYARHYQQSGGEASGKMGDWTFWLYRVPGPGGEPVRLLEEDLPAAAQGAIYSRQARRTDQASGQCYIYLDIDDGYPHVAQMPLVEPGGIVSYEVRIILLNQGQDALALQYRNYQGDLVSRMVEKSGQLGPLDHWVEVTWELRDAYLDNNLEGADLRLSCEGDGDEVVHLVEIVGHSAEGPVPGKKVYLPLVQHKSP